MGMEVFIFQSNEYAIEKNDIQLELHFEFSLNINILNGANVASMFIEDNIKHWEDVDGIIL